MSQPPMTEHVTQPADGTEATALSDTPMRIAMLTNLFHPVATGSATQSRGLARTLAALGHHVIVITPRVDPDTPEHEVLDGIEIYRIPAVRLPKMAISLNFPWLNGTFWPKNLRRIEGILRKHRIDLLHVHNHMFDLALAGMAMKKRLGLPVIVTLHTVIKHSNPIYNSILTPVDKLFLKHAVISSADLVICPDYNVRAYANQRFNCKNSKVIPYGIDPLRSADPASVAAIRHEYALDGKKVIVSVGHVHAIRNRTDIIRALPNVVSKHPDSVLVIVGGVYDDSPMRLAGQLGVLDHVIFAGARRRDEIPDFLGIGDIEAHWLNQDEGQWASPGIASLEAMSFGLPVLTVAPINIFGANVLADRENVYLVKPRDSESVESALLELLGSAELRKQVGDAARRTCQAVFGWGSIGPATEEAYRSVLSLKH